MDKKIDSSQTKKYTEAEVLKAMYACCENGDSTEHNKVASEFLDKYQESRMAWTISSRLLCGMTESEDVLGLAVVTLRHKIRNSLSELPVGNHTDLFHRLIFYIKIATNHGMLRLVGHLCVAVADLVLRMHCDKITDMCVSALACDTMPALLKVLEILPTEAAVLGEMQQLTNDSTLIFEFMYAVQTRTDIDMIESQRGCFLILSCWMRAHLLPLEQMLENVVVYNAFYVLTQPLTTGLTQEASDCFVAILEHVSHLQEKQQLDENLAQKIYEAFCTIKFPSSVDELKKRGDIAHLYIQIADTFAGLKVNDPPTALLQRGLVCYELLLQIAVSNDVDVFISSLPMWHNLFDYLPFRLELEVRVRFSPILINALDILFRKCRLPDTELVFESMEYETIMEIRGHINNILRLSGSLQDMINLTDFMDQLLQNIFSPTSYWSDVEASLFFLAPLIPHLLNHRRQVVLDIMTVFPAMLHNVEMHPAIREQFILLNTQCHKFVDCELQRHQFVEQLICLRGMLGLTGDRSLLCVIVKCCQALCDFRDGDLTMYESKIFSLSLELNATSKIFQNHS